MPTAVATASGPRNGPEPYRPDLNRRFAELLVQAGLQTRREVELSLREARRAQQPLARWLIRGNRVKSRNLPALRRLETLLVLHGDGAPLPQLLVEAGELSRAELKRALAMQADTGQALGEILLREGWLGRARQPRQRPVTQPLLVAASLAMVSASAWAMFQQQPMPTTRTALTAQARHEIVVPTPSAPAADLRFASLGDITPHLQRLRQRPGPYRRPPTLSGSTRQRAKKIRPLVNQYARKYSLPPALILAMIEQESSFNPLAQSGKHGVGLMQLVPHEGGRAAYRYSERKPGTPTLQELQDPKTNIRLGSAYLRLLLDRHFDDIQDEDVRVSVVLAAYNWGPTRMRRVLQSDGLPESMDELEALLEKHAPAETRDYVRKITFRMGAFG